MDERLKAYFQAQEMVLNRRREEAVQSNRRLVWAGAVVLVVLVGNAVLSVIGQVDEISPYPFIVLFYLLAHHLVLNRQETTANADLENLRGLLYGKQ